MLTFFLSQNVSAFEQDMDLNPPQEREAVKWFALRSDLSVSSTALETDDIKKEILEDYELKDDPSLPTGFFVYDPVVIFYHGSDEYGFDIERLKGYDPGFPIRSPEGVKVIFMGKILSREAWHYAVEIDGEIFTNQGIFYTVMEIQLGSGRACLPVAVVVDPSGIQGTR